jgi:hypothetical protein
MDFGLMKNEKAFDKIPKKRNRKRGKEGREGENMLFYMNFEFWRRTIRIHCSLLLCTIY